MKVLSFFIFLFFSNSFYSQMNNKLKIYTDYSVFYDPSSGEYIELKFQVDANSVVYQKSNLEFLSNISYSIIISQNDSIIINRTYKLKSTIKNENERSDFFDVKRYSLLPGKYKLSLLFNDDFSTSNPVTSNQNIEILNLHSTLSISDIQICETINKTSEESIISKSGYDLYPRLLNYFPTDCRFFPTYFEIYNPFKDSMDVDIKTTCFSLDNQIVLTDFSKSQKARLGKVNPIINKYDISLLPTGSYKLLVSVHNDSSELCSSSYVFDRSNNFTTSISTENVLLDPNFQKSISDDSLSYFLLSLIPISNESDIPLITKIVSEKNNEKMRKYIQSFWIVSTSRLLAYEAWLNYKVQVKLVDKLYATQIFKGFETDRGRVYLKYGCPTAIKTRETSPSEYPYEIWQYDKIKQFSNKRFIFYNPDLVNNHYQLLHSDMQGELKNFRWQQIIAKRNSPNQNIDDPNDGNKDHFGGESKDVFKQF
jgi:GWxTD domain-containing protein